MQTDHASRYPPFRAAQFGAQSGTTLAADRFLSETAHPTLTFPGAFRRWRAVGLSARIDSARRRQVRLNSRRPSLLLVEENWRISSDRRDG